MNQKFPKSERIHSKKLIERVFRQGADDFVYPFKVKYLEEPAADEGFFPDILITVPRKVARRAVKRNRIKRLVREAWRRNNGPLRRLCRQKGVRLHLALIYIAKEELSYSETETAVIKLAGKLSRKLHQQSRS